MTKMYTHAVAHRVMGEHGKPTDHLDYCTDIQQAYAIAQQLMAVGAQGICLLELKQPTDDLSNLPKTLEE